MVFADYLFEMPTKCTSVRVYLTADVFYCLCGSDTRQREADIVAENLPLLRDLAADRIEREGFSAGLVIITALDIEP